MKSKKYFDDLARVSKKNSMKLLKKKPSEKAHLMGSIESIDPEIKVSKKPQNTMI